MYKAILLPIDPENTASSSKAIETAVQMVRASGAVLHVLSVVPRLGQYAANIFPKEFSQKNKAAVTAAIERIGDDIDLPNDQIQLHIASGSVYDEIISLSRKAKVDLIIMNSHRPELSDYLLGPNAARVVRHADCSVMVVRD
ncbi:universal stress protein [Cognatishimia sp. SS12]|uniref:universal stress protein n=1 Tax=Cognatishimia sp. SS12 TaxID=2979465 RepID=UPI00232E3071|nr:universal stress protein [Cognatishimia sp. SS12]MDC0738076.1 universal stress protein [Cognatishimia sp. SS12]